MLINSYARVVLEEVLRPTEQDEVPFKFGDVSAVVSRDKKIDATRIYVEAFDGKYSRMYTISDIYRYEDNFETVANVTVWSLFTEVLSAAGFPLVTPEKISYYEAVCEVVEHALNHEPLSDEEKIICFGGVRVSISGLMCKIWSGNNIRCFPIPAHRLREGEKFTYNSKEFRYLLTSAFYETYEESQLIGV